VLESPEPQPVPRSLFGFSDKIMNRPYQYTYCSFSNSTNTKCLQSPTTVGIEWVDATAINCMGEHADAYNTYKTFAPAYKFTINFEAGTATTDYSLAQRNDWCEVYNDWYFCNGWLEVRDYRIAQMLKSPADRMREIIDRRQAPAIRINKDRKTIMPSADERELRARETLRRVVGNEKYQSFLKNGFVSVRAKSGLDYQIFPGHGITCVYDRGIMIDRLCVVLKGNFPPTDELIVRYLMILNNEQQFRSYANIHKPFEREKTLILPQEHKPLTEIFKQLKKVG
jgi:hypothetical protein